MKTSDLKRELKPWILSLVTGGGGGTYAPVNGSYVTVAANGTLTAERVATAGNLITLTDGGANSTLTYAVDPTKLTIGAGSSITVGAGSNVALDAGSSITTGLNSSLEVEANSTLTVAGGSAVTLISSGSYNLTIPATGTAALMDTANMAAGRVAFGSDANTLTGSANLFWDAATGTLNVNGATPTAGRRIHVSGNAVFSSAAGLSTASPLGYATELTGANAGLIALTGESTLTFQQNSYGAAIAPQWLSRRARGTVATPTQLLSGDDIGLFSFSGYHGAGDFASGVAQIKAVTTEDYTGASNLGSAIQLRTTANASSTLTTRMTVDQSGYVGIGTTAPSVMLHEVLNDAATNARTTMLQIDHNTTGSAAAGFGTAILGRLESATVVNRNAAVIGWQWSTETDASRAAEIVLAPYYVSTPRLAVTVTATSVGAITKTEFAQRGTYTTTATALTLSTAHHWVVVTAASVITLPTAATYSGQEYIITATTTGTSVAAAGAELISGFASWTLAADATMQIKSDGTGWRII